MTVSYQYQVASSTSGGFTRLLFMWRGSLYKLIYRELVLFLFLFGTLSAVYRYVLTVPQKRVMHSVALYVTGDDEYGRMLRRGLMRYLNLSLILVLRSISSAVKRRFPTLDHVVDSGFMTSLELELFQSVPSSEFNTYWIPCTWFINLLKEARRSHRLPDAQGLKIIMEEFNDFRSKCGLLWSYDWVSIPLVYTQVVTLATYSFFAIALVGRQYIEGAKKPFQMQADIYLPLFTILQFFFFMGLLKVAEQLINPFGDDDEDFELNWLIDRHTKVSYLGVDTLMNRCPPLVKDIYYDSENLILPYTTAAAAYKKKTYRGSVANMTVPEEKQTMFLPDIVEEEEEDTKATPTPRTSTASLATPANDSPVDNRRQISGSPPATPKMARNCPETVIQFDVREAAPEAEHHERRTIVDAMKIFSKSKGSTPRLEYSRKPFIALAKLQNTSLQPWPSATNLTHFEKEESSKTTPSSSGAGKSDRESGLRRRSSLKKQSFSGPEEAASKPPPSAAASQGVVNSGFSQDYLTLPERVSCQCKIADSNDNIHSDLCQYQCLHKTICQHVGSRGPVRGSTRSKPSSPRYLMKRQSSLESGSKKKGVRWKSGLVGRDGKLRRRTVDSVPTAEKMIVQTKSSPELSTFDNDEFVEDADSLDPSKRVDSETTISSSEVQECSRV
ncbi:bestrophin-4 isoform X2 [Orussus abietinus]|uniref:bestrophin-4 isoform X2 n=1 Tax=Orussus abietinus TaxID=222816 RepID=UPI000C715CBC|nr:bestrophin-4 isoform X2 [Orussus abietinus]